MKSFSLFLRAIGLLSIIIIITHCAKDSDSKLEEALRELNDENCQDALTLADEVLADEAENLEAAKIAASAEFCLSGLDGSDLNSALLDLQNSDDPHFAQFAAAVPSDVDVDDLIAAITTLTGFTGTLDDDAEFQVALYESYLSFVAGIVDSGFVVDEDLFDSTDITADHITAVGDALIDFDDRFIASGVATDHEIVEEPRETYCLVTGHALAGGEFVDSIYQDLVCCQLFEDVCTTIQTTGLTCADFDPDGQTACKTQDTD